MLIYYDVDNYHETIIDEDNFFITNYTRNFEVGEESINYYETWFQNYKSINRTIAPWTPFYQNQSVHAIIDRESGLVTKIEWQIQQQTASPSMDQVNIIIENIDDKDTENSSLGQKNSVFFSLTLVAMLSTLMIRKKKKK